MAPSGAQALSNKPLRVLVLAGGFALRWVLVNAGQASHWAAILD